MDPTHQPHRGYENIRGALEHRKGMINYDKINLHLKNIISTFLAVVYHGSSESDSANKINSLSEDMYRHVQALKVNWTTGARTSLQLVIEPQKQA